MEIRHECYEFVGKIGEGGLGVVDLLRHNPTRDPDYEKFLLSDDLTPGERAYRARVVNLPQEIEILTYEQKDFVRRGIGLLQTGWEEANDVSKQSFYSRSQPYVHAWLQRQKDNCKRPQKFATDSIWRAAKYTKLAHVTSNPRFVQSLERRADVEREAAEALDHPNIVGLLDYGHDERQYMIMEYVPSVRLGELVFRKGKSYVPVMGKWKELTIPKTVNLVKEVLNGLIHAHERGYLHRDIKPSNILVSANYFDDAPELSEDETKTNLMDLLEHGENPSPNEITLSYLDGDSLDISERAIGTEQSEFALESLVKKKEVMIKICDFGLAKSEQKSGPSITRTNEVIGTQPYCAPEVMMGEKRVSGRADIYSLGSMFCRLLTGLPASGETDNLRAIQFKIVQGETTWVRDSNERVHEDLDDICKMMIEVDALYRPTEYEARAKLEQYERKNTIESKPTTSGANYKSIDLTFMNTCGMIDKYLNERADYDSKKKERDKKKTEQLKRSRLVRAVNNIRTKAKATDAELTETGSRLEETARELFEGKSLENAEAFEITGNDACRSNPLLRLEYFARAFSFYGDWLEEGGYDSEIELMRIPHGTSVIITDEEVDYGNYKAGEITEVQAKNRIKSRMTWLLKQMTLEKVRLKDLGRRDSSVKAISDISVKTIEKFIDDVPDQESLNKLRTNFKEWQKTKEPEL
jgi:serine/threonine protein kinase